MRRTEAQRGTGVSADAALPIMAYAGGGRRHRARGGPGAAISLGSVMNADQFPDHREFRAIRLLWSSVKRQPCGLARRRSSSRRDAWRLRTQRGPYVNMCGRPWRRSPPALAGANALTVLPHTLALD